MGVGKPYTSLKDLQAEPVNTNREVLLADKTNDNKLAALLQLIDTECKALGLSPKVLDSRDGASTNIKKACVKKICEIISDKMGGGIAYDKYLDFGYGTEVQRCKVQKKKTHKHLDFGYGTEF